MKQCLPWMVLLAVVVPGQVVLGEVDQPTLDELLGLEPPPSALEKNQDEASAQESLAQMLQTPPSQHVFEQAITQMDEVSRRLGRSLDSGLETQRLQKQIIAKLEQVIAAARQQQSGSSGSGGSSSGSARQADSGTSRISGQTSSQTSGGSAHGGQASPGNVKPGQSNQRGIEELRSEWGHLPPRLRDELSEGLRERFSAQYRTLTEAYYQRLAELETQEP